METPRTIKIDKDVWEKFKEVCKKNNRTPSDVLRELITEFVKSVS